MAGRARELQLLNGLLLTNIPQFNYSVLLSDVAVATVTGYPTLYVNMTHSTVGTIATNDVAGFVMLMPIDSFMPTSMRQFDHAPGLYVDGPISCRFLSESPANWTGSHAKFVFDVLHILRGIYGSAVEAGFSANGNVIAVQGIATAGADANVPTAFHMLQPGPRATAGQI
jgi:hypothetical protein